MTDMFGFAPPTLPFVDIRNTRDRVAEEKARLCKSLNELLRRAPSSISSGSVQTVRQWQAEHKAALKVLGSKQSSVQQLSSALNTMQRFE